MTTWTGKRILFLAGMFEVPEKSLYIKSEMDTTKFFKENLKIFYLKAIFTLKVHDYPEYMHCCTLYSSVKHSHGV